MSDFKSKLPDLKELSSMTGKLFKGIKNSVEEIIQDYKSKRAETEKSETKIKPAEEVKKEEVKKEKTKPAEETADKKNESGEQ